jgi:Rps23 Pro-64 3,4-dihydroxylase Tpa1-like proline 4-hydroxylase
MLHRIKIMEDIITTPTINKLEKMMCTKKIPFTFLHKSTFDGSDDYYFEHCIVERKELGLNNRIKSQYASNFIDLFKDICRKLKIGDTEIYRSALNLTVNNQVKKCKVHTDHDFKHRQILIYLNDADKKSKTVILNNKNKVLKKIIPKKNRGVFFDNLPHYHFFPTKGYRAVLVYTFK